MTKLPFSYCISIGFSTLFILLTFSQCQTTKENANQEQNASSINHPKQKGAHIFGRLDSINIQPFRQNNLEWITLVPYAGQEKYDSPTLRYYRGDSLQLDKINERWSSKINIAHDAGFNVFLKPHVWLHESPDEKWRSDVFPTSEANWEIWKNNYRAFILLYAEIAEQNGVVLFCVGAEFSRLTIEKPKFWKTLIHDVRKIYSGELTYAANWHNEYEKITFWSDLDYIGVQAYFPLVKKDYPSVKELSDGWNQHFPLLKTISKKYDRKILFTEMGYKSTADSAIKPWEWVETSSAPKKLVSNETQTNCYKSFFRSVWNKEWFAGVHIWQMRSDFDGSDGHHHLDFTPQGKPAAKVIAKGFE